MSCPGTPYIDNYQIQIPNKMKKYPLHLVNHLNHSSGVKQRILMLYKQASSKVNLIKYSYLLFLILLGYSILVFQNKLRAPFKAQVIPEVVNNMTELQIKNQEPNAPYLIETLSLKKPRATFKLTAQEKIGFALPALESNKYPVARLVDAQGNIISTNQSDGKVYFGFKCQIPQSGIYTLQMLDFEKNQLVHFISKYHLPDQIKVAINEEKTPIEHIFLEEINTSEKVTHENLTLTKDNIYRFSIAGPASQDRTSLALFDKNRPIVSNVAGQKYYQGLTFKCRKTSDYTLIIQSDKTPVKVVLSIEK